MRSSILSICLLAVIFVCFVLAGEESNDPGFAKIDKQWDPKKDAGTYKRIRKQVFKGKAPADKLLLKDKSVKELLRDRLEELHDRNVHDDSWGKWAAQRREVKLNSLEKLRNAINPKKLQSGCANCEFKGAKELKEYGEFALESAEAEDARHLTKGTFNSAHKRVYRAPFPLADYAKKHGGAF
jgi:hypothetical protein